MAPRVASVRTEDTLNVSQDAMTSPREQDAASHPVQVSESLDVIEDSYKEQSHATRGATVNNDEGMDAVPIEDNEAAGPRIRGRNKGKAKVTNDSQHSQQINDEESGSTQQGHPNELLGAKVVVHEEGRKRKPTHSTQQGHDVLKASQSRPVKKPVHAGSTAATVRNESRARSANSSAATLDRSRPTSAAEALKKRLQAPDGMVAGTPTTSIKAAASGSLKSARGALHTHREQSQAPKSAKSAPPRPAQDTPAKARPETSVDNQKSLRPSIPTGTQVKHTPHPAVDDIAGGKSLVEPSKSSIPLKQTGKKTDVASRPARVQPQRTVKQKQAYDDSESSGTENRRLPAKQAQKPASSAGKAVPQSAWGASQSSNDNAKKHLSQASQLNSKPMPNDGERSPATDQMTRGEVVVDRAESHKDRRGNRAQPDPSEDRDNERGSALPTQQFDRSLGDSQNKVVDNNQASARKTKHRKDIAQPAPQTNHPKKASTQHAAEGSGSPRHGHSKLQPRATWPGASQEHPIVLAGGDRASTDTPTPEPEVRKKANNEPMPRETQPDKTPAAMPSSPPAMADASVVRSHDQRSTTGTTRKSAIIGFGRHGPLNQGTLSAREAHPEFINDRRSATPATVAIHGLAGERASSVAVSAQSARTPGGVHSHKTANNVADALSAFESKGRPEAETAHATNWPSRAAFRQQREDDVGVLQTENHDYFTHVDDFEDTTLVETLPGEQQTSKAKLTVGPTASQRAMPPPTRRPISPPPKNRAPTQTASFPLGLPALQRVKEQENSALLSIPQKRGPAVAVSNPNPPKRARRFAESVAGDFVLDKKLSRLQSGSQGQNSREGSQGPYRRQSRHSSQTVDVHGSPVPEGMVVEEKDTVLETYSQQVLMSSETPKTEVVARKTHLASTAIPFEQPENVTPPSAQPRPLQSNAKPKPAPPDAPSAAITGFGKTSGGRLLLIDAVEHLATDPFTGSADAKQRSRTTASSNFIQRLKSQVLNEQTARMPKQPIVRPRREQDLDPDPDQTLVEPQRRRNAKRKRNDSPSTATSSDDSSHTSQPTDVPQDGTYLAQWRNGLRPHQLNLFDELVNVSHRLVAHLSVTETTATDFVQDYRRRGLQLVEQMELSHAAQYRKFIRVVDERKKCLRQDMDAYNIKLNDCVTSVVAAKDTRVKERSQGQDRAKQMQDVLDLFC